MKHVPPKLQPWFDARRRFRVTNAEVQMARELGMNPKKFGGLANERQEPWKIPLREFIASCYRQSFGRSEPQPVLSLEEVVAKEQARRAEKQKKRQAAANEHADRTQAQVLDAQTASHPRSTAPSGAWSRFAS